MKREIKFRAWDDIQKKLIIPDTINFGDEIGKTTLIWYKDLLGYDRSITHSESGQLMQFTGLKDKNGKEIYEGDIVKFLPEDYSLDEVFNRIIGQVEWDRTTLSYGVKDFYLYTLEEIEVIGNIYENPELAED